ncbi:hypothetical protein Pcar_3159 [Syntrophotalea carbinolica DSM 2380]|uniref:WYL domain-containing protein n=1 Tax=Syntrophotalea carbinolica (strain DSM 2380 / NBRC 103641 / GraBd1) TaxID=338963 RepID=Q0C707_SYNC1|nr:hypothetical protein [Syntrophotalea carbinolica]ABI81780.1 hypothetical protein Pcar_3159 [Syntrophotalea carbinolica DSM 2380]
MYRNKFIQAIHDLRKVKLSFFSKEDGRVVERTCAPMDFGPSRRAKNKADRYHLWDYDSDTKQHVLSLLPGQVQNIEVLESSFKPSEFVTWATDWVVPRNWGTYS